jgi:NAD(P)-dependent dehydrogenase (short-subunit alcohol dehydrogenase family)
MDRCHSLGEHLADESDIANAALFLVSDAASWITGVVLPVDGGLTAGMFRMSKALSPEG